MVSLTDSWGGGRRWQPTHPGLCAWSGSTTHSLHPAWGQPASERVNSVKMLPSPKNNPALGCSLSTHSWQPPQETDATNLCSENETFHVLVSFSCLCIYTQRPAPRFVLQSQWTPEAKFNLLNVPLTAQLETERRKGSMKVTLLHWKIPAGFVELLKKTPTSYRCFQKLSNPNPEIDFLDVLAAVAKWSA